MRLGSRGRRRHAVEPILRLRESEPAIAHAPQLLARRIVDSGVSQSKTVFGVPPKMLGPAQSGLRAAQGICWGLPGVPAHRAPPLMNDFAGGQVGQVRGSRHESPAGGAAVRPFRRRLSARFLNRFGAPAAYELATKMQGIGNDVQCARLRSMAGARQRLSVTGACDVCARDVVDMVSQMALASARHRETALGLQSAARRCRLHRWG